MNRLLYKKRISTLIIQLLLATLLTFILSGCLTKSIVDKIGISHTIGIDEEKGKFSATVLYPNYSEGRKASMVKSVADNPSTLKSNIGHKSEKQLGLGQVRTFIFGDQFSRSGIGRVVNTICKDPGIGIITFVTSDIKAEDIIKTLLKGSPLYISNLIESSVENEGVPETNLHTLVSQYHGKGIDVYLPNINLDNDGQVAITGLAIFKGDKVKLKISNKEAFIFKMINEKNKKGYYDLTLPKRKKQKNNNELQQNEHNNETGNEDNFAFEVMYGKHEIKLHKKGKKDTAIVNLTLNVELKGIPKWIDISKNEDFNYLQNTMEKLMEKDIKSLLVKFQKNEVDPLGFGMINRSQSKEWDEEDYYKQIYPKMKFSVNTNIILRTSGGGK